jgi:hypothetical protein
MASGGSDPMIVEVVASVIGTIGGIGAIAWMLVRNARSGHVDREAEDAARAHFDRHGTWPDAD